MFEINFYFVFLLLCVFLYTLYSSYIKQRREEEEKQKTIDSFPYWSTSLPSSPSLTPFTISSLSKYNGKDPSLPIYVSIKGRVFDVSDNEMYKPKKDGSGYAVFAGRDCSRAFALTKLNLEEMTMNLSGITKEQQKTLDEWEALFDRKYKQVGVLMHPKYK